jgi:hypothetical protein
MHRIFLFLSSARTGTQWLASNLAHTYGDLAVVTHEPIGVSYRPREFLRAYDRMEDMLAIKEIHDHLAQVEEVAESKTYIELGWQNYAAIPLFVHKFGSRVGVIELARHPVTTSTSLLTLAFYTGGTRVDNYTRMAFLDPSCPGVVQKNYAHTWRELSGYEKCLYWWTEIYLYAEELRNRLETTDFLLTRMEDLLGGEDAHLETLTSFLGLPFREELAGAKKQIVDVYRFQTNSSFDWKEIFNHPNAIALATRLGYDTESVDGKALERRYRKRIVKAHHRYPRWRRIARRGWRFLEPQLSRPALRWMGLPQRWLERAAKKRGAGGAE